MILTAAVIVMIRYAFFSLQSLIVARQRKIRSLRKRKLQIRRRKKKIRRTKKRKR